MTRPSFRSRLTVLALLCLAGGALGAQPRTVIQSETRVVLVDAIVTEKKGAYIRDLSAKDFRVWEDNKEQVIKSMSFESASASAQPRYLVLFFDSAGIEGGDQILLQQAVSRFIDANVGPNRRMAVVNYNGTVRVAQQFTDNAGWLKDAVKMAGTSGANTAAADLRKRNMPNALGGIARNLSALPGRKIVILLTTGLSAASDQRLAVTSAIEAANMSGVAIYPVDVRPIGTAKVVNDAAEGPSYLDPSQSPRPTSRGSRGGAINQPQGQADETGPKGLDSAAASQQILFELANGTGGLVIPNSSALLASLQEIGQEQDEYYVLSYTPPESKEGSCHTLRVKVDRKGTLVRARSNYCTVKPLDLLAGTSTGKDLESRATGAQPGNIAASIELPYFYISAGVARVNVSMDIMPDSLKFETQKGKLHAEINLLGVASTPDGSAGARFSDALKLDFENQAQLEKSKGKPVHYEKEFKIAPGQYSFTMAFSSGAANFGKLQVPLVVEPWKPGDFALSGLVLSKEVHTATDLARAATDLGIDASLMADRTPLIAEGMQVVPAGSNQFLKSEPAFFYFEVYASNIAAVNVRVRVLDRRTGEPKWDSGLSKTISSHVGGSIPVNTLAPGSYQLEVTVHDSTDKQIKRTTDFEIR